MRYLPAGTVTFLFTDVEGSTKLLHELGAERYAKALAEHRRVLRNAFERHGGVEVDTQGDAFFVAFPTAPGAIAAASEAQAALEVAVRMGIHTGTPHLTDEGYVGADVHKAARIAAAGHGGQVLVSVATSTLVEAELLDLGEHRLKDLTAPERIYQLGEADFPPLKTLFRTNLPIPATPFLGRERELAQVRELLQAGAARLLTLMGPGGTGKTRLALQSAAESSERYPAGVFWVPLAPLRDPELVLEEAAQAVGAANGLIDHLADKHLLLLLDNFEHVVEAAPRLSEVLTACPNLTLLVTSRELLQVPGEQAYPVPPLDSEEGIELFEARARAVKPDFEPDESVPQLCERLDNLPLAVELAAARVRMLSPQQLLDRLSGRLDLLKGGRGTDPRQQTLRATIEWSHELLDEEEKRLFGRLAVFRGGCTLNAAEAICDADVDMLQSLVDKSLVRVRDESRFWMLETIREYALEQLEASGEADDVRGRHAEEYLRLAEEAEPSILGVNPGEWLRRLEREHDNLRSALDWLEQANPQRALRLGGALWEFWCLRGHAVEGWRRTERLVELDEQRTLARAKVLTGSAHLAPQVGAVELHERRAEQALELYRELQDPWGMAFAEWQYAGVFTGRGDFASALPLMEESAKRLRAVGDEHRALQATRATGWCHLELGDTDRGIAIYRELLERTREAGDIILQARALGFLAGVESRDGRIDEAFAMITEAYELDCEVGDMGYIAEDFVRFSLILLDAGRAETAAQLVGNADAIQSELGLEYESWLAEMRGEAIERARRELGDQGYSDAVERGAQLSTEDVFALATAGA
jgi:predicted ATPase